MTLAVFHSEVHVLVLCSLSCRAQQEIHNNSLSLSLRFKNCEQFTSNLWALEEVFSFQQSKLQNLQFLVCGRSRYILTLLAHENFCHEWRSQSGNNTEWKRNMNDVTWVLPLNRTEAVVGKPCTCQGRVSRVVCFTLVILPGKTLLCLPHRNWRNQKSHRQMVHSEQLYSTL